MYHFENRNIIVTGGSRGIGAAVVRAFMEHGANVAFTYNKNFRLSQDLADSCAKYPGKIFFYECDVSDYQDVQTFVNNAVDEFGSIDTLVNNAGIWEHGKIEEMTVDAWRRTMQINLDSVYYFSHFVVKHMKERGIKGHIINISSTAGQRGEAFYSHYAATKGGIISLTKSLAAELGPEGIHVNCVAPGWVRTDMTTETLAKDEKSIKELMPLKFIPEPVHIAGPVLFLASDYAEAITGEIVNVNAGSVLCG